MMITMKTKTIKIMASKMMMKMNRLIKMMMIMMKL